MVRADQIVVKEKLHCTCGQFSSDELDIFNSIRAVFDLHRVRNPCRATATLHRYALFGGMHICQKLNSLRVAMLTCLVTLLSSNRTFRPAGHK